MICTNCGAHLMDSDQFCPECGAKAIKDRRCPECGAVLREGTKFCHKCGRPINEEGSTGKVSDETLGIPVDAIERNILSETAAEIKADRRAEGTQRKTAEHVSMTKNMPSKSSASHGSAGKGTPSKSVAPHAAAQKNRPVKSTSPQKKRMNYREEEDWDDDDWDDEEGVDIITIMTAIVGCVILVVVAMLGYHLYRQYVPKNYDSLSEDSGEERQEQETDERQQGQTTEDTAIDESEANYTLTVIQNVNVRDNPSTSGTNVLKVAKKGETYPCYDSVQDESWYKILLEDGTIGYVYHEYVTVE